MVVSELSQEDLIRLAEESIRRKQSNMNWYRKKMAGDLEYATYRREQNRMATAKRRGKLREEKAKQKELQPQV